MDRVAEVNKEDNLSIYSSKKEELYKQRDKILDLYQLDSIPLEELTTRLESINSQLLQLDNLIADFKTNKKRPLTEVKSLVVNAKSILDSNDLDAKRILVQSLIDRIEIGDDITIYWSF